MKKDFENVSIGDTVHDNSNNTVGVVDHVNDNGTFDVYFKHDDSILSYESNGNFRGDTEGYQKIFLKALPF